MYTTLLQKSFYLFLLLCLLITGCEKETELTQEDKRKADASFNNTLVNGVGNVIYEKELVPNLSSQLVFKMAYFEDTLAAYGKINGSGQLEYIHTTVLAKKGGSELFVTEIYPETSISRMYSIFDDVKGNMVVEVEHYSPTEYVVSINDLDWSTGEKKVLTSTHFSDGAKAADYSAFRLTDDSNSQNNQAWNCDKPQPSDEIDQTVDNYLDYFACGGLAYDTHVTLSVIKEAIVSAIETVKNAGQYTDKQVELESLKNSHSRLSNIYEAIKGKVTGFKFEKTTLAGLLKRLEVQINKLKASPYDVLLVPFEAGTDTNYDELTDDFVKISFTVVDAKTNLAYTDAPESVTIFYVIPGTDTYVAKQVLYSSTVNGLVTFKWDPTTLEDYENHTSLEARWAFTSELDKGTLSRMIQLQFIKPKVVLSSGGELPNPVIFAKDKSQSFKLVNEDNRELAINYGDVTITGNTNSMVTVAKSDASGVFMLTLSTNETSEQYTAFDVLYKGKKMATVNAKVSPYNYKLEIGNYHPTPSEITVVKTLENGDAFTTPNFVNRMVRLTLDGVPVLVGQYGIPWMQYKFGDTPSGPSDLAISSYPVTIYDYTNKRNVTITLDVVLENTAYRRIVGKTVIVDRYKNEVKFTTKFTFNADGTYNKSIGSNPPTTHSYKFSLTTTPAWVDCSTYIISDDKAGAVHVGVSYEAPEYFIIYQNGTLSGNSNDGCDNTYPRWEIY